MQEALKFFGMVVLMLSTFFGVYQYNERHDARAQQLRQIELRLDHKIEADHLKALQERYWYLAEKYGASPNVRQLQELDDIKRDIREQELKIENIIKQQYGGVK